MFQALSEPDKQRITVSAQLELARRNVGYSGPLLAANGFYIFKRIPISETLTEHQFIAAIDEVEAAVHAVIAVIVLELQKCQKDDAPAPERVIYKLPT